MGGGGKKKRKSNSRKGVPPTPEEEKKKEVNRYEVLGEARQLLSPSRTPSAAGSRLGLWVIKKKTGLIIWPLL